MMKDVPLSSPHRTKRHFRWSRQTAYLWSAKSYSCLKANPALLTRMFSINLWKKKKIRRRQARISFSARSTEFGLNYHSWKDIAAKNVAFGTQHFFFWKTFCRLCCGGQTFRFFNREMLTLSFGIFFRQPLYFGVNCSRRNVHLYFFYSVQKIDAQISTTTTGATRAEGGCLWF